MQSKLYEKDAAWRDWQSGIEHTGTICVAQT